MKNYKDPISLFKQTNFSKTIWWKLKVNISGYQNETGNRLATQIFKNRIFKIVYPNSHQYTLKSSRLLIQLYEDGYVCWINLSGLIIEQYEFIKNENLNNEQFLIKDKIPSILKWIKNQSELKTPDRIIALSGSFLWVVNFDCPGLLLSISVCISFSDKGILGGQPSITHPMAGP